MRTRFALAPCVAVLALSQSATAAESAVPESQLILLHQPARPTVEASPEKARAKVLAMRATLARSDYAQFFTDLQLTESRSDKLANLIAEHSMLTTGWSTIGVNFTPQEEDQQLGREVLSQIEQFLGRSGFQKFEEYQDTLAERFQLKRLVRLLIAVGHPLTSEQSSQLVSIMRAERGDRLELWPNSDEFDRRIKPRFDAVLSAEQREFGEQYFAGRAARRHDPRYAHSPD